MPFRRTDKYKEAIKAMQSAEDFMAFGGSGSGKSVCHANAFTIRAAKYPGLRQLVLRHTYKSTKASLWNGTFPWVGKNAHPSLWPLVGRNETDRVLTFPNGSQIMFGGAGNAEEVERWLGSEFGGIWINECSEFRDFEVINAVKSRLRQDVGQPLLMLYDMNPPSRSHWSYSYFIDHRDPLTGEDLDPETIKSVLMNPADNEINLPKQYVERLKRLKGRARDRFWLGKFMSDVEGALWSFDMIQAAKCLYDEHVEPTRTVIGVDPAASDTSTSDEAGIVVGDELPGGRYQISADYSGIMSARITVNRAVQAYIDHRAAYIVVEKNNGGDWLPALFEEMYPKMQGLVKTVHASKGKKARAEPISALYELAEHADQEPNRVAHAPGLDDLEDQMMQWVPSDTKMSPGRIDAAVWAIEYLRGDEGMPMFYIPS